ncbi:NPCBM/NEW2 domain-containing protein, partial [Singulisphaera rosea]
MQGTALILFCLLGVGPQDYSRPLDAKALDQATLDTEGYGEKKAFTRENAGLRIKLAPGEPETGWKTPQTVRFGGNFKITANFLIKTLPKPGQEDGAAFGIAIAFQDINQPDITLLRMREPNGAEIFRTVEKAGGNPMQPQHVQMMMMMGGGFGQPGGKPPKPPRPTFPASGDEVRVELQREGMILRYQVLDAKSNRLRYLGQSTLQPQDVAAVKLFAANRNGAEPVNVLLKDVSIHAERINGLGTIVRTVFDRLVYADPTSIDKDVLILGGEPKAPPPAPNANPAAKPGEPPKSDP